MTQPTKSLEELLEMPGAERRKYVLSLPKEEQVRVGDELMKVQADYDQPNFEKYTVQS